MEGVSGQVRLQHVRALLPLSTVPVLTLLITATRLQPVIVTAPDSDKSTPILSLSSLYCKCIYNDIMPSLLRADASWS